MSRKAYLFVEAEPFQSASGAINAWVEEELRALGHELERHNHYRPNAGDTGIPLANARRLLTLRSRPPADLAVFCDLGLGIHPPSRELARRTFVFFHGLHGQPTLWLGNPLIDLYGTLSPYLHDTLSSLLMTPDWRQRRCLDPRGAQVVGSLVPTLPCLEAAEGDARLPGGELPESVQEALDRGEVLGHAIQPTKANWLAVCSILLHLRALTREHGHPPVRLVVAAQDFALIQHALRYGYPFPVPALAAALQSAEAGLEDLLLPVPHLKQPALFRLFREARFGLAYNASPEPFGMYVLESVLNGCPIYTNGAGNNRHALPPGHGIIVRESGEMAAGAPNAYATVAARILQDLLAPGPVREECQRGAALIRRTFTREAFSASLRACVDRLESDTTTPHWSFDELVVRLSPLVRRLDEASGAFSSDYVNARLSPEERDLMNELLGRPAGQLGHGETDLARMEGLFDKGVLSLAPPAGAEPPRPTWGAWSWYPPGSAFLEPSLLKDTVTR
ncbi:glycosyltransferase [Archangium minus]|uniref:Glycosyltransferase n=1 Tax=Archangium minus TaxID=83450 RepID=A0ABY9WWK1_9BACT|nr:glycosyltransferase [Archangium minus]